MRCSLLASQSVGRCLYQLLNPKMSLPSERKDAACFFATWMCVCLSSKENYRSTLVARTAVGFVPIPFRCRGNEGCRCRELCSSSLYFLLNWFNILNMPRRKPYRIHLFVLIKCDKLFCLSHCILDSAHTLFYTHEDNNGALALINDGPFVIANNN
jgi:hypothetical protein